MNKYKEISYNTIIFAIGNIGVKLIQFFLLPLLTVKLTKADYNTADLLTSTLEVIMPLMTLGLSEAVFRFCIKTDYDKKSVFSNSISVAVLGVIFVVLSICVINFIYPQNYWYLFSVLYALNAFDSVINNYIRGVGKVKTFAFTGIAQSLALAAFAFVFVYWLGYGLTGYLLSLILAYCVRIISMVLFGGVYRSFSFKSLDKRLLKLMILYALPMVPNNVSWWLVHTASKYICTGFLGEDIAALYAAASKLPAVINMLATIFLQAWSISTAKTATDEDKGKFNSTVFRYLSAFVLCCASAVFVVLPYISKFLLQGEFYEGWIYSALLIFAAVLTCYSSYFGAFYGANFKTGMVFISTLAGAVVNVALSFAFIQLIGIYALLAASCLTYLVIVIIRMATTRKYSLIKISWFKEIPSLAIVLAQAVLITFAGAIWWLQLILFVLLVLVRITDIIAVIKTLAGLFRRRKKVKPAESAEPVDNAEVAEPVDNAGSETVDEAGAEAQNGESAQGGGNDKD